jgi:hypothetical protein
LLFISSSLRNGFGVMKKIGIYTFLALLTFSLQMNNAAHAGWGKLTVTDGAGDTVEAHNYPLGIGQGFKVQDQAGDKYGYKSNLFGIYHSTDASIFGNNVKVHHGLITGTSVQVNDMAGDTVKSKKFLGIGPRITTVNASGLHSMVSGLMQQSATPHYDANAYAGNLLQPGTNTQSYARPEALPVAGAEAGPVDPNAYANP